MTNKIVLALLITTISFSTEAQTNSKKKARPLNLETPIIELNGKSLPKNYKGIDVELFHQFLISKRDDRKRGEFEALADYEARTKALPFNLDNEYAFDITSPTKKIYDLDNQQYSIDLNCGNLSRFSCTVATLSNEHSTYNSANGYGATITVEKHRLNTFGLLISESNDFLAFDDKNKPISFGTQLTFKFHIPVLKAKELKDKTIKSLLVGNITYPWVNDRIRYQEKPTFNSPTDIVFNESYLPFIPTKMVLYVLETGEILAIKNTDRVDYKYLIPEKN